MLTAQEVKNAKPRADGKIDKISDSGGLQLHVMPTGTKVWRLAYRFGGKQKTLTIGKYPVVTLSDARLAREEAKAKLRSQVDPVGVEAAPEGGDTFNEVADLWLQHLKDEGKKPDTIKARIWQLKPLRAAIGTKRCSEVRAREILACLKTIRETAPATAVRCRIVVGQVFRYAVASDVCEADPTTALKGAMPTHKEKHHAAAKTDEEIKALLLSVQTYKGHVSTALALRLAPYVFLRSNEIRNIRIEHIDLERSTIRLPAKIMKGGKREHIVPLSRQAKEIVEQAMSLTDGTGLLFSSSRGKDRPLSENTFTGALRRMGFGTSDATFHGFRGTASTLLHDAFPGETLVIEAQMSHIDSNKSRGPYNSAEYLDRRIEMMQWYADKLDHIVQS